MLHYLLNCSAIWLLALICFDIFLRKSTFHQYNRFYLLFSLLAGIIIPLFSVANNTQVYKASVGNKIVSTTLYAKENLIQNASNSLPAHSGVGVDWTSILSIIYLAGCLISLCLLLRSVFKIAKLISSGKKIKTQGFTIVETGQIQGPFSFFGLIFIADVALYSAAELSMILTHENRHNKCLHSIDLLLLELAKIVFWFHPLIYVYQQRMMMVHEFQADQSVTQPLTVYGTFLAEQSITQTAPQLAHSFYHSPLKNRIMMLTRKTSTWSKSKMLLAIPVMAVALLCCSKNNVSSKNARLVFGNTVTYKGNTFEMYAPPEQAFSTIDPKTGKLDTFSFETLPAPIKMNGQAILSGKVDKAPVVKKGDENNLIYGVFVKNKDLLEKLEDGEYRISVNNTVVDKNGAILYYDWDGITNLKWDEVKKTYTPTLPQNVKKEFEENLDQFIENIKFDPALKDGKPVVYVNGLLMPIRFIVKNHKATAIDDFSSANAVPLDFSTVK